MHILQLSDVRPKPMPRKKKELKKQQQQQAAASASSRVTSGQPGRNAGPPIVLSEDIDDEDDDFRPVNIDVNVVKNLMESYGSQQGVPGPASNILGSMGLHLPRNLDDV